MSNFQLVFVAMASDDNWSLILGWRWQQVWFLQNKYKFDSRVCNSWAGASHNGDCNCVDVTVWAALLSSRRFEPWWQRELRLLKFFIIIIIISKEPSSALDIETPNQRRVSCVALNAVVGGVSRWSLNSISNFPLLFLAMASADDWSMTNTLWPVGRCWPLGGSGYVDGHAFQPRHLAQSLCGLEVRKDLCYWSKHVGNNQSICVFLL